MDTHDELEQKYAVLFSHLNERQQHLVAAADAERLGRGGITVVARASGFARPTLYKALRELHRPPLPVERVRRPGAGRKKLVARDPHLVQALEALIDPDTRGTRCPRCAGPVRVPGSWLRPCPTPGTR